MQKSAGSFEKVVVYLIQFFEFLLALIVEIIGNQVTVEVKLAAVRSRVPRSGNLRAPLADLSSGIMHSDNLDCGIDCFNGFRRKILRAVLSNDLANGFCVRSFWLMAQRNISRAFKLENQVVSLVNTGAVWEPYD